MANLSFGAQVDAWVKETEQRITAVFRESSRRTVSIAQGYLTPHVDTGFLRASVRASNSSMPQIQKEGDAMPAVGGDVTMVISGSEIGQTIYVGYTAYYAPFLEYGTAPHIIEPKEKAALHFDWKGEGVFFTRVKHPGTRPVAFVGRAAAQWNVTVNQVVQELRNRAGVRA